MVVQREASTVCEDLKSISLASNLTDAQRESISYGADCIRYLEKEVQRLEAKMANMRTIEEVYKIIEAKDAGLDVEIEYANTDGEPEPYVYKGCW